MTRAYHSSIAAFRMSWLFDNPSPEASEHDELMPEGDTEQRHFVKEESVIDEETLRSQSALLPTTQTVQVCVIAVILLMALHVDSIH